ncbi:MAG: hypothetical protein ABIV13_03275, partial [Fimbriimonadales bacterium]
SALGIGGCSTTSDPTGNYYAFVREKPTSNAFDHDSIPVATFAFSEGNSWKLSVIMAEPIEGTWTRAGNTITLKSTDGVSINANLEEDGSIRLSPPFGAGPYWKMSKEWEASMQSVGAHDALLARGRDIGTAAVMLAGDNDESLPKTRAELVEGLSVFLADISVLDGFEYTFAGGKLPPEKERGSVELGKLTIAGKTVTIYLNGDVK